MLSMKHLPEQEDQVALTEAKKLKQLDQFHHSLQAAK